MGPLRRVVGFMDRFVYEVILENTMRPWARAKNWFQRRRVDLLDWSSQSPDLNPIEHLWEELESRVQGVRASNVNQKFDLLEAAWKDIPMSVIHKLLDSMPCRCQAVIDAKGYATRY
uniref:Tc1-like transposase DDE domain-containing protein n=1 Tax=Caenorhabditis japonica TaxID=281687 RepID=A0A8R1DY58_CAEJA